jgi:hypothetical protein
MDIHHPIHQIHPVDERLQPCTKSPPPSVAPSSLSAGLEPEAPPPPSTFSSTFIHSFHPHPSIHQARKERTNERTVGYYHGLESADRSKQATKLAGRRSSRHCCMRWGPIRTFCLRLLYLPCYNSNFERCSFFFVVAADIIKHSAPSRTAFSNCSIPFRQQQQQTIATT